MPAKKKPHRTVASYWRSVRRLAKHSKQSIATTRARLKRKAQRERQRKAKRSVQQLRSVPLSRLPKALQGKRARSVHGVRWIKVGPGQFIRAGNKAQSAQAMLLIEHMRELGLRIPEVVEIKVLRETYDGRKTQAG